MPTPMIGPAVLALISIIICGFSLLRGLKLKEQKSPSAKKYGIAAGISLLTFFISQAWLGFVIT